MADSIDGLVLCQVGEHRLAFRAREVAGIDLWATLEGGVSYARKAWQLPAAPGRLLTQKDARVVVDALEICAEPSAALPVPPLLRAAAGGALFAFVLAKGQLWPLLKLPAFARYLEAEALK